jgi:plasmid stabilization system protein ParE
MTVRFHPAARAELLEARRWYQARSPVAAMAFAQAVEVAVFRIAESPIHFPIAEHGTRRIALRRFPYNLFYRVGAKEVIVGAVAHQKRRPYYWKDR